MNHKITLYGRNSGKTFARNFQYDMNIPIEEPHFSLRKRIHMWLTKCRHHEWGVTGVNGFFHPSEERCLKCGEYRHLIRDHRIMGREEWKTGRHPLST